MFSKTETIDNMICTLYKVGDLHSMLYAPFSAPNRREVQVISRLLKELKQADEITLQNEAEKLGYIIKEGGLYDFIGDHTLITRKQLGAIIKSLDKLNKEPNESR